MKKTKNAFTDKQIKLKYFDYYLHDRICKKGHLKT